MYDGPFVINGSANAVNVMPVTDVHRTPCHAGDQTHKLIPTKLT